MPSLGEGAANAGGAAFASVALAAAGLEAHRNPMSGGQPELPRAHNVRDSIDLDQYLIIILCDLQSRAILAIRYTYS
ncbi:hypothetical protein ABIC66_000341 [Caulobacter sp. 1776]